MIDLCAKFFPWAKFRATKGAVKLHLLLDHDGLLPHFVLITEGKKADVEVARCRSDNWASQIYPDDFASGLAPGPDATLASAKR